MMIEKELGIYENSQFPSMWKTFHSPNKKVRYVLSKGKGQSIKRALLTLKLHEFRYQNIVTGLFEMSSPPPAGGGILADVS